MRTPNLTPRRPSLPEDALLKGADALMAADKYATNPAKWWNSFGVKHPEEGWRIAKAAFRDGVRWERARRKREGTC